MLKKVVSLVVTLVALGLVAAGAGAFLYFTGRFPPQLHALLGTPQAAPIRQATRLMEDIKFKDLKAALAQVEPSERDTVDPERMVEGLLGARASALEIHDSTVVRAETDDTGNRIRVKVRTELTDLTRQDRRTVEQMYYFVRSGPLEPWFLRADATWKKPLPAPTVAPGPGTPGDGAPSTPEAGKATNAVGQDGGGSPAMDAGPR